MATASGNRLGVGTAAGASGVPGTASGMLASSMGRPMTGAADGVSRPMTGIRGAGYPGTAAGGTSAGRRGVSFDPLNQAAQRSDGSPGLDAGREQTPEDKIKALEKKVRLNVHSRTRR